MLRLLAWLKYADERLQFTRGVCADDDPEPWRRNDHLGIDLWIELGLPDERRIKKACTQAAEVALFAYNSRAAQIWWQQNQSKCVQFANLSVWYLDDEQLAKVSAFADRTMTLDERRIKKACTQAAEVAVITYNSRAAQLWWQQNQS